MIREDYELGCNEERLVSMIKQIAPAKFLGQAFTAVVYPQSLHCPYFLLAPQVIKGHIQPTMGGILLSFYIRPTLIEMAVVFLLVIMLAVFFVLFLINECRIIFFAVFAVFVVVCMLKTVIQMTICKNYFVKKLHRIAVDASTQDADDTMCSE